MLSEIKIEGVTVDDLGLDFTLPGYPHIELTDNRSNVTVSIYNVGEYVNKVIDLTLGSGVKRQVEAFRSGFSQVFPYAALKAFTPDELVMMFGKTNEDWSLESKFYINYHRRVGSVLMYLYSSSYGLYQGRPRLQHGQQECQELAANHERDDADPATGVPAIHYRKPQTSHWR